MELLTEQEKDIIKKLGEVWTDICGIIPPGPAQISDREELLFHIHALQMAIKSNAAGRAYPEEFRVLGGFLPGSTLDPRKQLYSDGVSREVHGAYYEPDIDGYGGS